MTSISIRSNIQTEIREFLKLAIPLASAQVAQATTGFVDAVMMGWLGQEVLAAGGLATMIFMAMMMTGIGIISGVSPLVAEAYGAKQNRRVGQITRQGLWIALLLAIPGMMIIANLDGLMHQFGQAENIVTLADTYLNVMAWGLFPAIAFAVLRGCIVSLSEARPVMFIVVTATGFNIIGNYVLAFGKLGFPEMGIAGLAVASICAHWIMFLSLLGYMVWHKALRQYSLFKTLHRLEPKTMQQLLWVGGPIGITTLLEYGLFTTLTFFMGALGTPVLAAHQIVLQTLTVIYMVPLAMSYAATVRVGQWFGQRDWQQVRQAAFVSIGLAVMFLIVAAIALFTHSRQIIGLYLNLNDPANANVLNIGVSLMTVAAFGQVLDGVQRTANGVLQGLQDTRIPMLLGTFSYWGVGLTTSYFLGFHTDLAGTGIWLGSYIGIATAAIAFIWRFRGILSKKESRHPINGLTFKE
ncbi:putative multidrug resistance protein NorM [Hyella patelloides LEGE 07179]|uniref:Probable multidrug resistance protein NorM n=1 Tax=Hyella patelloides LEGE 07179 TaxID=945734 RepID=A0A563VT10_9CYAN|nr:MATE family efflux transporter [Hyella patelloides]VEP14580.1 putative multidrug resistance protein NorM [Hyella patelloides LEGE 07179]